MSGEDRYTVEDCGCVRYNAGDTRQTIVWCGTADRDTASLRAALDRAEAERERVRAADRAAERAAIREAVITEREERLARIATVYPEAAAEARRAGR